jgi:hypothetical protein
MGFGNGIGIGWPMASSGSTPVVMGYFSIMGSCKGAITIGWTSQLIDTSLYNEGDYVDGIAPFGGTDRYILGEIRQKSGPEIAELYGPAHIGC